MREEIAADPAVKGRLVAAYLIETVKAGRRIWPRTSAVPACRASDQGGMSGGLDVGGARRLRAGALRIFHRAVVWNDSGRLVGLSGRAPLCVNPLLGAQSDAEAPPRLNLGAANATSLEWGARPGFMARQVGAQCVDGILRVTRARSASLRPAGDWAERLKARGYNLFYADLEADAQRRFEAFRGVRGATARGAVS